MRTPATLRRDVPSRTFAGISRWADRWTGADEPDAGTKCTETQLAVQSPPAGQSHLNSAPCVTADTGGHRKRRSIATTVSRLGDADSRERPANAVYCACFAGSALNSGDRATGASTGSSVPRLPNVAASAAASEFPQNAKLDAMTHRS